MKGYFKNEAKFMLMLLLGVPLVVIAAAIIATFFHFASTLTESKQTPGFAAGQSAKERSNRSQR